MSRSATNLRFGCLASGHTPTKCGTDETGAPMDIDTEKVDKAAIAILYLTLHDRVRAWKGMDWDVLGRLHEKGLIHDPVGKQKSVVFTALGLKEAERCFRELFTKG